MSAPYSAPPPSGPPPRNHALLGVAIGILVVLVLILGFGIFVVYRFARHTQVEVAGTGASQVTDIRSPLGNLHVQGKGDNAQVNIDSPFGKLKVVPEPDLSRLDMSIYPGAVQVTSSRDSAFNDQDFLNDGTHLSQPGAEVFMQGAGGAMEINVAEFRTSASTSQVAAYYRQELGHFGSIERKFDGSTQTLKVKQGDSNVREVAIRPGNGGTHFVLVRVQAGSAMR